MYQKSIYWAEYHEFITDVFRIYLAFKALFYLNYNVNSVLATLFLQRKVIQKNGSLLMLYRILQYRKCTYASDRTILETVFCLSVNLLYMFKLCSPCLSMVTSARRRVDCFLQILKPKSIESSIFILSQGEQPQGLGSTVLYSTDQVDNYYHVRANFPLLPYRGMRKLFILC